MKEYLLNQLKGKVISGIYKLEFPNHKSYIGQSQNIYKRIQEHNNRAKVGHHGERNIQICEQAIAKYGQIEKFILLEEISDLSLLDEREHYWIQYYQTDNKDKGYNLLDKGNVSGRRGVEHVNALFSQDKLNEIIDLLINHTEYSIKDIASKYNVNPITISRISTGKSYTNPNLSYPLRKYNHESQKKQDWEEYFETLDQLIALKEDLKYSWWLKMDNGDIYNKYHIPRKILYDINAGKRFAEIGDYTYPIRSKSNKNTLTQEQILNILYELRHTPFSMTEIGNKYNIGRKAVSNINNGTVYPIKNYNYPARKINKQK